MALIKAENLTLSYEGTPIVSGLNFHVEKGCYFCIVGENGSGKTTLMNTILGLHTPSAGTVTYGDGLKENKIGYLPQRSDTERDFPASVYEVVLSGFLGKSARPFYTKEEKEKAKKWMGELDILSLSKKSFQQLSGGQKQRVLLARALCSTVEVLLLDEPVAGLDPLVTEEMYEVIDKLNRELGVTVIMVSHDIPAAISYAHHILHIGPNPLYFGTAEEYKKSEIGSRFLLGGDKK